MAKSFKDIKTVNIVIDFNNQVYRSHYATLKDGLINSDQINMGCILGLCNILRNAIAEAKKIGALPKLIICKDQVPIRKRNLYKKYQDAFERYKSDRNWDGITNQKVQYKGNRDKSDLTYNPIDICELYMNQLACSIIYAKDEEADDVISTFINNHKDEDIHLYSTDKDLWQLLGKFPKLKIFINGSDDENEKHPNDESMMKSFLTTDYNKIHLYKTIRGDSGDNIRSILNYPFKKTIEVFHKCDGSVENYLKLLIEKFGKDSNQVKHFFKYIGIAQLNWQVIELKSNLNLITDTTDKSDTKNWNRICWEFETPSLLNSSLLKIY